MPPGAPSRRITGRCAEQNLYTRAKELVGDREPRQHEFSVQLRAFDSSRSGSGVGIAVLLALCSSLLQKSIKGGLAVTGGLNLGGSIETIFNPVAVAEVAIENRRYVGQVACRRRCHYWAGGQRARCSE